MVTIVLFVVVLIRVGCTRHQDPVQLRTQVDDIIRQKKAKTGFVIIDIIA